MSLKLQPNIPANVVEIGQEVTQGVVDALNGATSPDATNVFLTRANSFNTADAAVRITQTGAGEAFRVEDDTSPDSTPFVITADGRVGIGTTSVSSNALTVGGITALLSTVNTSGQILASGGITTTIASGTAVPLIIQNNGTGNSFVVNDEAGDTSPFVITADGSVGIKVASPIYSLDVAGITRSVSSSGTAALLIQNNGTGGAALFQNTTSSTNPCVNVDARGTADAVRITNTGSGNSFVVEDEANPDASPFVIDSAGRIGIGTSSPSAAYNFNVSGLSYFRNTSGAGGDPVVYVRQEGAGNKVALQVTNQGSGHSLLIEDSSNDATPFIIDNDGNVAVGYTSTTYKLDVNGTARVTSLDQFRPTRFAIGDHSALSTLTSGTGAATQGNVAGIELNSPTTAVGHAVRHLVTSNQIPRAAGFSAGVIPWASRRVIFGGLFLFQAPFDASAVGRITFGRTSANATGDITASMTHSIEVRCVAGGALTLNVTNASAVTSVTSTFTPTLDVAFDLRVEAFGGTVTLFVNGSQVASTTGGPSANSGATANTYGVVVENVATATASSSFKAAQLYIDIY